MPAPTSPLTIQLTLSGRPLGNTLIRFDRVDTVAKTNGRGHVDVELPTGRICGTVAHGDELMSVDLVNAVGLRRIRIDLRLPETALDDPVAVAAMPNSRYVPLRLLGQGAAGRVYECRDTALDRLVAIKILREDYAGHAENNERFLTEARRLARVTSPNLLGIYDVGVHEEQVFMVAEYVDGPNLEQLQRSEGRFELATLAAAGVQLAQALAAVHEAGLIHRDIKPSNGLVDRRGVVKLADFGLARPMVNLADPQSRVFGTPPFMSPEQLQGNPLGPSADLYSLGASLFDMATGHPPFHEGDLMLAALFDPPPDVREERPDCSQEMAALIARMLAKDPADRPRAVEVIDALMPFASEESPQEDQPYFPRLSGSALGLRWLAGPKTRRMDRLERAAKDAGAALDLEIEIEDDSDIDPGGPTVVLGSGRQGPEDDLANGETRVMDSPQIPLPTGEPPPPAPAPEPPGLVDEAIAAVNLLAQLEHTIEAGAHPACHGG